MPITAEPWAFRCTARLEQLFINLINIPQRRSSVNLTYPCRQQHHSGLMRCATHTKTFKNVHTLFLKTHKHAAHGLGCSINMGEGRALKSRFTLNSKYIFSHLPIVVSRHGDSFDFIQPSFEISGSEMSTSIPVQWR